MMGRLVTLILAMIVLAACPAMAKENVFGLDSTNSFNIYIGNGAGGVSAIKNVDIEGLREVSGVVFIVFREQGFNSQATEGLVRLDAVQVVLPSLRTLSIQRVVSGDIK